MGREIHYFYSRGTKILIFQETNLKGSYIIDVEKIDDERGFFSRSWDKQIFQEKGLNSNLVQCNISFNKKKGTLRGMHFQVNPFEEIKIVRCLRGRIFDVIIDLREESETYKEWINVELDDDERKMIYIPEGFAHAYFSLAKLNIIYYKLSNYYHPRYEDGIIWNDKSLKIKWPIKNPSVSKKDKSLRTLENFKKKYKYL